MKTVYAIIMLLLLAAAMAQESRYYEFTITGSNGSLSYTPVIVRPGSPPVSANPAVGYKAELVSFGGAALHTSYFSFAQEITVEDFDFETGEITSRVIALSASNVTLSVPYYPDGKQISIYDTSGTKVLEIPVMQFADTCGNAVCDPHESHESCADDCPSGGRDDYCDRIADGVCDADCAAGQDADCHGADNTQAGGSAEGQQLVLVAFAVAVIIGTLWYYRKKKDRDSASRILERLHYSNITFKDV